MNEARLLHNFRDYFLSQKGKNRITVLLLVFFAMVSLFVVFLVWFTFARIKEISVTNKIISQGEVVYAIDVLNISDTINIVGWAVDPNVPLPYADCFVLLKDLGSNRYYQLATEMMLREDLPAVFDMENARFGGFQAKAITSRLNSTSTYQVYFLYFDRLVETNCQFSLVQQRLQDYQAQILEYEMGTDYLTVMVQNTSNSVWRYADQIRLGIWKDGLDFGMRAQLPITRSVEPGETVIFSFENIDVEDWFSNQIEVQMLQEGICYFGDRMTIKLS